MTTLMKYVDPSACEKVFDEGIGLVNLHIEGGIG